MSVKMTFPKPDGDMNAPTKDDKDLVHRWGLSDFDVHLKVAFETVGGEGQPLKIWVGAEHSVEFGGDDYWANFSDVLDNEVFFRTTHHWPSDEYTIEASAVDEVVAMMEAEIASLKARFAPLIGTTVKNPHE